MTSTNSITKIEIRYIPDSQIEKTLPKAMLGLPDGFLPIDKLETQDTPGFEHFKRPVNHAKNLETIYRAFQVIDGTDDERCAQLRIRSMSWGDAVVVDGVGYYVAAEGFVTRSDDGTLIPVTEG